MNAHALRSKSEKELNNMLLDLRKEQFNLRMQQGTGTLNEPHQIRTVRRQIARVKTVLNQIQSGKSA